MTSTDNTTSTYVVVCNHEEQYSIWPLHKEVPKGWRTVGKTGPKAECLAYIDEVWTDMRPLSLRQQMADRQANSGNESRRPR
ncbi:MbtH family protein [Paraliomyxa miuraensis]|uniref:MbtH family protein n=1 Tax=Paraliomyxa miuraensis TaxID=376150 RepID=UPI002259A6E7|nr:MbtH family NRPS accessory protein [Paraliomyxa miuraensis]MCX4243037.1 MbtH family NRPS accessory protein [Paraliomyxa miuraensis]